MVAFHLVTVGSRVAEATAKLFAENAYRDYLELHGLSVQLTEALAEYWHARVRAELGFGGEDSDDLAGSLGRPIEDRGTRSGIRPARTWPTGPRWCVCWSRSGSA